MSLPDNEMQIEYDEAICSYYVAWKPMAAMGMGKTKEKALEELRQAAHFGVDTAVNLKLAEISGKEGGKYGQQS
jgi:predicted RNase H-like HicB family nuclease